MKILCSVSIAIMVTCAWGQAPKMTGDDCYHASDGTFHCYKDDVDKPKVAIAQAPYVGNGQTTTKPLKCGKYQHWEDKLICPTGSWPCHSIEGNPKCVDTMHEVTEKEWQELMERLKKLENPQAVVPLDDVNNEIGHVHYLCLYKYAQLSPDQQHACKLLNMIESAEKAKP